MWLRYVKGLDVIKQETASAELLQQTVSSLDVKFDACEVNWGKTSRIMPLTTVAAENRNSRALRHLVLIILWLSQYCCVCLCVLQEGLATTTQYSTCKFVSFAKLLFCCTADQHLHIKSYRSLVWSSLLGSYL